MVLSSSVPRPIRLAHVITGLGVGGAEMMLTRLVRASDPAVIQSSVISLTGRGALARDLERHGAAVHALDLKKGSLNARALVQLTKLLRTISPDVVQTWLYHADLAGLVAARLAGCRAIAWNIRCSTIDDRQRTVGLRFLQRTLAALSGLPQAVVANSVAGRLAHERLGYRPRAWHVIPNGVDSSLYYPDEEAGRQVRASLGLPERAKVVGIVGRYDPMKDHVTFLRAAAVVAREIPNAHFILVGRGVAEAPELREFAQQIPQERILILGERQDVPQLLNALDLFVLSSSSEGFPNVLVEAMASGVPVVSTNVGDAAAIVGDAGLVAPSRDPSALARAICQVLALPDAERRREGQRARLRAIAEYDIGKVAQQYIELYSRLATR